MWFAEYATERHGNWETVHRKTGWYGARENWKWGGVHASLRAFGESLRVMEAGEDVRMAAGEELLRLIRLEDHPWFLREVMDDVLVDMWDRVDRGELLDPEVVRAVFSRAEASRRTDAKP